MYSLIVVQVIVLSCFILYVVIFIHLPVVIILLGISVGVNRVFIDKCEQIFCYILHYVCTNMYSFLLAYRYFSR